MYGVSRKDAEIRLISTSRGSPFFVSDDAAFITGSTLTVNGAQFMT